jgi:hypothetical protein
MEAAMRYFILAFALVSIVATSGIVLATTIHVPADQPTIQAGIDAAAASDTVLVAEGTYTGNGNRDIDFLGKAIVVMSENGAKSCVIDCEGDSLNWHRGFYFHNFEDSTSVLKGFTIRGGYFVGNEVQTSGGAILCENSSPLLTELLLEENYVRGTDWPAGGGGIYCYESSPRIEGNRILHNQVQRSRASGGGIACLSSSPIISNNVIMGNAAGDDGGGIWCWSSSTVITGNIISGNSASSQGGGVASKSYSTSLITNNTVSLNSAFAGGGIYADFGDTLPTLILRNNTIVGNSAGYGGGMSTRYWISVVVEGSTFADNRADTIGGGINCDYASTYFISNTILWNDDSPYAKEISYGMSFITIEYSDVEGGRNGISGDLRYELNWGEGMIDADPLFVLPNRDDYRLLWGSPCIDTGHPDSLDADGTRGDMGAHFFDQRDHLTLYVTPHEFWVGPGEQLDVTYTAINRWAQPEPFWLLSQVLLPDGSALNVLGPDRYTLPAHYTAQVHITHPIPNATPSGTYEYWSRTGMPPSTLYDQDRFSFDVIE